MALVGAPLFIALLRQRARAQLRASLDDVRGDGDAVAAGALGAVERRVRLGDQPLRQQLVIPRVPRSARRPPRRSTASPFPSALRRSAIGVAAHGFAARAAPPARRPAMPPCGSTIANSSPPKRAPVSLDAHLRIDAPRHLAQHRVAGQMPVLIVDALEVIHVDHQAGDRLAGPLRARQLLAQARVQIAAVVEAGEEIREPAAQEPRAIRPRSPCRCAATSPRCARKSLASSGVEAATDRCWRRPARRRAARSGAAESAPGCPCSHARGTAARDRRG